GDDARRGAVGRSHFAEVDSGRLDAERRADDAADAHEVLGLMLGARRDLDLLGDRTDFRVRAAGRDVEAVLRLALTSDARRHLRSIINLLVVDLDPVDRRLDLRDREWLFLF